MQVIKRNSQSKAENDVMEALDVDSLSYVNWYRDSEQFRTSDNHIIIIGWISYMNGGQVGTTAVYETSGEFGDKGSLFIYSEGWTPLDRKQIADALNKANLL